MEPTTPTTTSSKSSNREEHLPDLSYIGDELSLKCWEISSLLGRIDRAHGLGAAGHIVLPQLVVCGDSSAGKSLVLERVTGFPFPRKTTRFATELILKHHPRERRMTATILPHFSRQDVEKTRLASFHQPFVYLSELPRIIEAAGQCMGVRASEDEIDKPAFVADVLALEVVGNTGMHLTIIDLPGFLSGSENERDAQLVSDLVDSYLKSPRTIILAVAPASGDIDTRRVTQRARHFDQDGHRTVGIITKPDLINTGTKEWVGRLIHSLEWSVNHWFILKSPSPAELRRALTLREMKRAELDYFAAEPWKRALDAGLTGVDKLRSYLQDVLHRQIKLDLPNLLQDLRMQRDQNTEELGTERDTPHQIRVLLTHISFDFQGLVQGGIDGDYGSRHAGFFNVAGNDFSNRLRAQVHLENQKFANYMREFGETRQIVDHEDALSTEPPIGMPVEGSVTEMGQILLSQKEMTLWAEQVYHQTLGRELPGKSNHTLLAELFRSQSTRWGNFAREHIDTVASLVSSFLQAASKSVIKEVEVRQNVQDFILRSFRANLQHAIDELNSLLQDEERQPITYNHYFAQNVAEARNDQLKRQVKDPMAKATNKDSRGHTITSTVQDRVIPGDLTEQACFEAQNDLAAYYKVAMNTFVDNVCRQVIERHLLAKLPNIFSPVIVSAFSDHELVQMAGDSPETELRRMKVKDLDDFLSDDPLERDPW